MDRRKFLKEAALAGAAIGLTGCVGRKQGLVEPVELGLEKPSAGAVMGSRGPRPYKVGGKARMKLFFEPYELELRHVFTVSSYSRKTTPGVQVRIEYDGFTGYGEASMPPYLGQSVESVMKFLKKVDLSRYADPFMIEDILADIDSLSEGDSAAKAAVDIALHDLVGKLLGHPWYRLLGLDPAKALCTTFTIGIDTPEVVREKTLECAGLYKILKVKVGVPGDRELIETVRSVTDLPLAVDANQGWTDRSKALDEIFWLADHGVVMVEQPMAVDRPDDNAWLTEQSPVPVFADEAVQRLRDIPSLRGVYNGINIKLMKCTGMREAWKMICAARAEGMKAMLGCMTETSCGISAAAQLSPAVDFADLDGNLLISNDLFSGVTVVDGRLTLPSAPGIGVTPLP